ncbi:hypothetical protein CDEST_13588 [Colletotrichum destructivum]|uniref:Uncharacterized protein n=1 Tax=Colletotrichum destructivum TaxID=34406 RepID=A0AAX4IZ71_9PEZI|nr:hypothetical protein CDEST_13588 [Colletotrichum destructivum]
MSSYCFVTEHDPAQSAGSRQAASQHLGHQHLGATALVSQIPGYTSLSLATCPGTIPITTLL